MSRQTSSTLFSLLALVCLVVVTISFNTSVKAQSTSTGQDNCVNCHEDLYFLHDTGNWFCLRESPMNCVDCHGGDPEALTRETAHFDRAAHPVINEDVSKCQECHPAECGERVRFFDQMAGISQVRVAAPYTPAHLIEENASASPEQEEPGSLLMFREVIALVLVTGIALTIFFVTHRQHN